MGTPSMGTLQKARTSFGMGGVAVEPRKKYIALAIAAVADVVQVALFPAFIEGAVSPPELALDAVTAVILLLVLGFSWRLVAAFALELVPGFDLFPSWTAAVLSIPTRQLAPAPEPPPDAGARR